MSRAVGIDPGTVRCGVAITDSGLTMAFPRPALANTDSLIAELRVLVNEEHVDVLVVGRPLSLSGNETASTTTADEFFERLVEAFDDLTLIQWDERLTTREAQRSLSKAGVKAKEHRDHVDSAAAVIMLQNYLDGQHVV